MAVEAAGVHLLDTSIRRGEPGPFPPPQLPMTPGGGRRAGRRARPGRRSDVARAPGRRPPRPGQRRLRVAGRRAGRRAASGARRPRRRRRGGADRHRPHGASPCSSTPPSAADDVVVVTAAAGGLGTLFVQAARHLGATVVGLAGGADEGGARRGARRRRRRRLRPAGLGRRGAPAAAGRRRRSSSTAWAATSVEARSSCSGRAGASCCSAGRRAPSRRSRRRDLAARSLSASWSIGPAMMKRWGSLEPLERRALADAAAGVWSPVVTRFPLADAAAAHRALEGRATVGKAVLVRRVASARWTRWPMSPPRSSRWPTASCGARPPPPAPTGGPRTRVLHPIWEWDGVGARRAGSPRRRCRRRRPTWPASRRVAELLGAGPRHVHGRLRRRVRGPTRRTSPAGWRRFADGPAPVGYDPSIIPGWDGPESPPFGVLRLTPHRCG